MATLEEGFHVVSTKFGISSLNKHQKTALSKIVEENKDVFVNLPTGFGKSIIYQALPLIFDYMTRESGHIVVVVSPLISLMNDQVSSLRSLGVSAVNISSHEEEESSGIENGEYAVVYGSPEAWLSNERWRGMLNNKVYSRRLCAIAVDEAHVVRQWGTSQDKKMAAFREWYSKLHELRSLAPKAPVVALTATATKLTRDAIMSLLEMHDVFEIKENPNKLNLSYMVEYMDKDNDLEYYFDWLADEIMEKKQTTERTIIYCQTIKQCGIIYATIRTLLGNEMFVDEKQTNPLVEMLHSCTPIANKQNILESFQTESGTIRLLIATIAFGMGVDCKGVHRVIHFGPSKNVEAYVQETGRAGRDGCQSIAYVLYHGIMLNYVDNHVKTFVNTKECRRKILLEHFETMSTYPEYPHLCCDNCAAQCNCGLENCNNIRYPSNSHEKDSPASKVRQVHAKQKKLVETELKSYHKSLVMSLVGTAAMGDVKTLTNLQFMIGFLDHQVSQVLENIHRIFTMADVYKLVEIWDKQHADKIISVISNVFKDISPSISPSIFPAHYELLDDDILDEWNELFQDDELYNLNIDNLSFSNLTNSLLEKSEELLNESNSVDDEMPPAVLAAVESMGLDH